MCMRKIQAVAHKVKREVFLCPPSLSFWSQTESEFECHLFHLSDFANLGNLLVSGLFVWDINVKGLLINGGMNLRHCCVAYTG